ncbi:DUF2652 domain-containing protein [Flavobacterium sp.]|uniref:DUF2652 domain-containing protein n=1 Tax=Flavobacterium sp. TaxID=239 RepID=UPI00326631FF
MPEVKPSLLVIADISGFTRFVNETEISHSRHIVAELLESVIAADSLHLTVAEIEGDAVLFYRYGRMASRAALLQLAESFFLAFHNHLSRYRESRVCRCGACATAENLTIKVIAHAGPIELLKVRRFRKPFGIELIRLHRLLKNSIPHQEYLMLTSEFNAYNEFKSTCDPTWLDTFHDHSYYEDLGNLAYTFHPLSPLRSKLQPPKHLNKPLVMADPVVREKLLNHTAEKLHKLLINISLLPDWDQEVKKVLSITEQLNRVGTRHVCVLDSHNLKIETVSNPWPDKIVYAQQIRNAKVVRKMLYYIILESRGNDTHIRVEVHYSHFPLIGGWINNWVRKKAGLHAENMLRSLKAYNF